MSGELFTIRVMYAYDARGVQNNRCLVETFRIHNEEELGQVERFATKQVVFIAAAIMCSAGAGIDADVGFVLCNEEFPNCAGYFDSKGIFLSREIYARKSIVPLIYACGKLYFRGAQVSPAKTPIEIMRFIEDQWPYEAMNN